MQINITVTIDSAELEDGQSVGQLLAEKFGGAVSITTAPPAPEPVDLEVLERLAEIDTSDEDDALDAATVAEPAAEAPVAATPAAVPAPATQTPAAVAAPAPAVVGVDLASGPDTSVINGVEVDSAGVPWNATIHSGNKQKYGKGSGGAKAGRWQWKRGTDETAREEKAQQLAADLKSAAQPAVPAAAPVAAQPVQAAPAPAVAAPVAAVPVAENVAPPTVAAVAQPVVAPVVAPVVQSTAPAIPMVSAGGWTWANFLESMTATGTTAEAVLGVAAQHGVTTIPELSPRVDILEAVATALSWPAPVQTA